jgi:hypothetical protein
MKKLFIGCGIIVVLILGGVGFILYQVWPQMRDLQTQWTVAFERIESVDREYPFDPLAQTELDAPRFAQSLDVRAAIADKLIAAGKRIDELAKQHHNDEGVGVFDMLRGFFQTTTTILPDFAAHLEEARMSWREFAWHTRLLWACLYRVDAGVGPPELEPLRGSYERLKENYARAQRESKELPTSSAPSRSPSSTRPAPSWRRT